MMTLCRAGGEGLSEAMLGYAIDANARHPASMNTHLHHNDTHEDDHNFIDLH